jgi:hypothetical protein
MMWTVCQKTCGVCGNNNETPNIDGTKPGNEIPTVDEIKPDIDPPTPNNDGTNSGKIYANTK